MLTKEMTPLASIPLWLVIIAFTGALICIKLKSISLLLHILLHKFIYNILYLLSTMYKRVFIIKPNTSRLANSEKYIVCKFFKGNCSHLIDNIMDEYPKLKEYPHISSILNNDLDYYYINKIEEYNAILGQQQIENINSTISLFTCKNKNEKIETLKKNFIQKCVHWCEKHNIQCNKTTSSHNIFLNSS